MIISGASQHTAAQTRSTQRSEQSRSAWTDALASGAGSGASQTDARPLSGINVLSNVETTLPNGNMLSVFRFDLGARGVGPSPVGSGAGASSAAPTDADRRDDQEMLRALKQLAGYFDYKPSAADIKLEGTAAADRSV